MSEPLIRPIGEGNVPRESLAILERMSERQEWPSNCLRTIAHSPAALESLMTQVSTTDSMRIPPRTREAIALRVAELNGCDYCLAAHTALAEQVGVDFATARRYRLGLSEDPKEQALLALATKVVLERGHHAGFVVETARQVGASDAEIVEVVTLVALNIFTNYVNSLTNIAIDYPLVEDLGTARSPGPFRP